MFVTKPTSANRLGTVSPKTSFIKFDFGIKPCGVGHRLNASLRRLHSFSSLS